VVVVWAVAGLWLSVLSLVALDVCDRFHLVDAARGARCEHAVVRYWTVMVTGQVVLTIGAFVWAWRSRRTGGRVAALALTAATWPLLLAGFLAAVQLDGRVS
jgi:hypothetical protein